MFSVYVGFRSAEAVEVLGTRRYGAEDLDPHPCVSLNYAETTRVSSETREQIASLDPKDPVVPKCAIGRETEVTPMPNANEPFDLQEGSTLANKYRVLDRLGTGYEGEVYRVAEIRTGIERAAKLYFPSRDPRRRVSRAQAKKLHKLRRCEILIRYQTEEEVDVDGVGVTAMISEYVDGPVLADLLRGLPGRRMPVFEATHLLHALVVGMESIHLAGEYHGDLHAENVLVAHHGLRFELKLIDFFHWDGPKADNRRADVCDVIRLYYDALGGSARYARHPPAVKSICCGLKRGLILERFPTMSRLRKHLESMTW